MSEEQQSNDNLNSLLEDALSDMLQPEDQEEKKVDSDSLLDTPDKDELVAHPSGVNKKKQEKGTKKKNEKKKPDLDKAIDEEEMDRFFASMTEQLKAELPKIDPEEAQARINESVPQIFDLMQNLLSRDLLYPALSDLSPKFDKWLKENVTKIGNKDKKRYEKQRDLINEILKNFDDTNMDTKDQFVKNLDLMEQMQSLGPPPDELTVQGSQPRCPVM